MDALGLRYRTLQRDIRAYGLPFAGWLRKNHRYARCRRTQAT